METDKPLVSVLLAAYKPNEKWFREQLLSLENQTFRNIELLIYDDCPQCPFDESIAAETIKSFPFQIIRGEKNLGSNKAFELLTAKGNGKYFSYCDQDDVWHSDKIQRMTEVLEKTGSPLVYCDLDIIDADGRKIGGSFTDLRKNHVFKSGKNLAPELIESNFVTGCAMMIRADTARKAIPFMESIVHDQWLALNAALDGAIELIDEPLIDYRQHGENQTSLLNGVTDKKSYYEKHVDKGVKQADEFRNRVCFGDVIPSIDRFSEFYHARQGYAAKMNIKDLKTMIKYRSSAKKSVLIEVFMKFIPEWLFKRILKLAKEGKI